MGFDAKSGEENHENQLSLFELPQMQFVEEKAVSTQTTEVTPITSASAKSSMSEGSSAIDYNSWVLAHSEPEQSKTSKFMTMSMALHAAAILGIAIMSVPLVEQAKTETITIEIAEPAKPIRQARGADVIPTKGGTPVRQEKMIQPAPAKDVGGPGDVVVAAKHGKTVKVAKAVKAHKAAAPRMKAAAKSAHSVAAKTNFKAVPMTIDDISAPELDQGELAKTNVKSELNEDFNDDFASVDRKHKKAIAAEEDNLNAMTSALAAEQDDELKSVEEENKADAARFAALQDSIKKNNAQAIASAVASEKAAAAAAAKEAAARDAAARASALAAAKAKKAGIGHGGSGTGNGEGSGAGKAGAVGPSSQVAGAPTGVRSLDQLRQMPGNPRPQYDRDERKRGDAGEIVFHAYVSKDGYVSQFRMMRSTGFRNLDAKTLNALRKWRFYPGQEGWVELPFRWDIKGGMQEDGGRLRTSVSQR